MSTSPEIVCLFCKQRESPSVEHVFARPLGDVRLTLRDVCQECNSRLGQDVDPKLDRDARLAHARNSAGLVVRKQAIREVAKATDPVTGSKLRMVYDNDEQAAVMPPQRDGREIAVGRELMPATIRQMLKAEFRKARVELTDQEETGFVETVIEQYDRAPIGHTVEHTYRGLKITLPKLELRDDTTTALRHAEDGAIERVAAKIALEVAAGAFGIERFLQDDFDDLRSWVLHGKPDLRASVSVIREPAHEGGDATQCHIVILQERDGALLADIGFYGGAFIVRVNLGPAIGIKEPWESRFEIVGER